MPTALVIDGAYFLRRVRWSFPHIDPKNPAEVAQAVHGLAFLHLATRLRPKRTEELGRRTFPELLEGEELYRIFFYDCPPLLKKLHRPISKQAVDLAKTPEAIFRLAVHDHLQKARKVALRLGHLSTASEWRLRPDALKLLISSKIGSLADEHFEIDTKQKGVDMRLGLDVTAMALKRQVNQIVLVAADADFVPATKIARREGVDVVLDAMGGTPANELVPHVDGVRHCRWLGDEWEFQG